MEVLIVIKLVGGKPVATVFANGVKREFTGDQINVKIDKDCPDPHNPDNPVTVWQDAK